MKTTREIKRAEARKRKNEWSKTYLEVSRTKWPDPAPDGLTHVFVNNAHVAMVYGNSSDPQTGKPAIKVMLKGNFSKPIHWRDMQECKNQLFGNEVWAKQYLPPESELVDEANLYWFFVERESGNEPGAQA